jgi:hypothetical protein
VLACKFARQRPAQLRPEYGVAGFGQCVEREIAETGRPRSQSLAADNDLRAAVSSDFGGRQEPFGIADALGVYHCKPCGEISSWEFR